MATMRLCLDRLERILVVVPPVEVVMIKTGRLISHRLLHPPHRREAEESIIRLHWNENEAPVQLTRSLARNEYHRWSDPDLRHRLMSELEHNYMATTNDNRFQLLKPRYHRKIIGYLCYCLIAGLIDFVYFMQHNLQAVRYEIEYSDEW